MIGTVNVVLLAMHIHTTLQKLMSNKFKITLVLKKRLSKSETSYIILAIPSHRHQFWLLPQIPAQR